MGTYGAAGRRVGTLGARLALVAGLAMVIPVGFDATQHDGGDSPSAAAAGPDPAMFPLDPQRFAETREGAPTFDGQFEGEGQRAAGSTYQVAIAGRGGVPIDAAGVVIYLTAVDPTAWGFMTVSACEDGPPTASSVNYDTGITVGNEIVADLSPTGDVCVFTHAATDLTIDVVGYVPAGNSIETFRDRRLLDTREGASTLDGQSEGIGRTAAGSTTTVQVTGRAGIPAGTETVIVNVAALDPNDNGFLVVHPCLASLPPASSLNYSPGVDRANELIAQLDADGEICIFTQHDLDLIMDVVGYVPPGTNYVDVASRRYLETRPGATTFDGQNQGEGIRAAGSTYTLPVAGRGPVPGEALAVVANVAAIDPVSGGFLTVHPCLGFTPTSASLNYRTGVNGANEIVARVDDDGEICLFTFAATHLIVDVTGYLMADLSATTDSYDTFGNVLLEVGVAPTGAPAKQVAGSVLDNDIGDGALTVASFDATSDLGGTVDMNADGTFTYDPPPGATGVTDTFEYTMTDGSGFDTATVMIDLTELVWFVDNAAPAGGDGTSATPFDQLAAAGAASGPGDTIFVFVGDGTDTGYDQGIVLDANQNLIGEKVGLTVGGTVLVAPGGGRPTLSASGGADVVTLGSDATVRSFVLEITGAGAAISSSGAGGAAIDVDITASSEGIDLDGATGTFTFTDVDISSSGGIALDVDGPANVSFVNGTITQSGNAPAVDVSASTGTIHFDAPSTITATNGTGLQFDDADGTYAFQGPVTLNGGDAGIDILNGSAGTFTFGDTTITDPSGAGLKVDASDAAITFTDSTISQANAGAAIDISGHNGTFTFGPTNTVTATGGTGLQFSDADSTYAFPGLVTLNGGDAGIDILGGSAGTFTFADTTTITNPTGSAVDIVDFEGQFDYDGSITSDNDTIANIDTTAPGSAINFNSTGVNSLTSTDNPFGAIFIFDADGDITFTTPTTVTRAGFSPLFTTDGDGTWTFNDLTIIDLKDLNGGVDVFGNTGTVNFTDLNITTDSAGTGNGATGFLAGGNNVINVFGNSSIDADGGAAIALINIAEVDITFQDVTSTNNTNTQIGFAGDDGIDILDVDAGTFTVTGTTTVTNADGVGTSVEETGATVTFEDIDLDGIGLDGVISGVAFDNPGSLTINGGTVNDTGGDGVRIGSGGFGSGVLGLFELNGVTFTSIGGSTANLSNSVLAGSGNVAGTFSCTDLGGNTGKIFFNGGVDSCPP